MRSKTERDAALLQHFDRLVELPAAEKSVELAALRRDDAELAAAVEAMLSADGNTDGPLEAAPQLLAAIHAEPVAGEIEAPLAAGSEIGPFRLQRCLGQGGMGEVWLASRMEEGFHQQVALKRIRRGLDSATALRRFQAERRILAELSHPNIARFIDGGVDASGLPWYAMSYVEGLPLHRHVQAQALGVRERVALLLQIAEAVAYAQNQLIVHRDLKPSNVLVDHDGVPHLLDFGIAKLLEGDGTQADTLTAEQALTPMYAAPEQILGGRISTATDVYALGVMLFELLTDTLPHARAGLGLAELVAQVRGEVSERPSQRWRQRMGTGEPRSWPRGRSIDADLDAIVLTALRAEPERRYASAALLADDLRRWLDGNPIRARADTAAYRLRKFIGRHRYLVGSAAAVLLALLAGFGTALWQAREARAQARLAADAAERAGQAQADAEAINRFFAEMLANARAMDQSQGSSLTVTDWVRAALPRLDQDLAEAAAPRATLRRELGSALHSLGDAAASRPVLEQAVREAAAVYGDSIQTANARVSLAVSLFALGETALAQQQAEGAVALIDRIPQPGDDGRLLQIQARTTLIRVHSLHGDDAQALVLAERNLADRIALYGADDDPRLAVDYNNLAGGYNRLARLGEAEVAQRKSLALLQRTPNAPVARIAFVEQALCILAVQRAQYGEGLAACERAAASYRQALGEDSIELAGLAASQAHLHFAAGDTAQARALLTAAVPRLEQASRMTDLRLAWVVQMRLALRAGDWATLAEMGPRLLAALPAAEPSRLNGERIVAQNFTDLGLYLIDRDETLAASLMANAESLLARNDIVPYYRASAALAAAVAAQAGGDDALSQSLSTRGLAALATHMPKAEAQALWSRWWPEGVDSPPE